LGGRPVRDRAQQGKGNKAALGVKNPEEEEKKEDNLGSPDLGRQKSCS
jgi:hypothetical protein